jgi:protein dispatched 1
MEISAKSGVSVRQPSEIKDPIYNSWQNWVSSTREKGPAELSSIRQTGGMSWAWMPTEKAFVSSAIQGIMISMLFSFAVLLIATRNLIQAFVSFLCVTIIIIWVVAIMVLKGWELGVSESVAVVIVIGLSVDYVIHLSSDYMHSSHQSRHEKIQQAFAEMGVSIFSGSISTIGAGACLFMTSVLMLQKFAILITSTIAISYLMSMLFFGAVCHLIGP